MKTIILEQPGQFRLTATEPPAQPGPGEALVHVRTLASVGRTFMYLSRSPTPLPPRASWGMDSA